MKSVFKIASENYAAEQGLRSLDIFEKLNRIEYGEQILSYSSYLVWANYIQMEERDLIRNTDITTFEKLRNDYLQINNHTEKIRSNMNQFFSMRNDELQKATDFANSILKSIITYQSDLYKNNNKVIKLLKQTTSF